MMRLGTLKRVVNGVFLAFKAEKQILISSN
jgi:hypothetical protein